MQKNRLNIKIYKFVEIKREELSTENINSNFRTLPVSRLSILLFSLSNSILNFQNIKQFPTV